MRMVLQLAVPPVPIPAREQDLVQRTVTSDRTASGAMLRVMRGLRRTAAVSQATASAIAPSMAALVSLFCRRG